MCTNKNHSRRRKNNNNVRVFHEKELLWTGNYTLLTLDAWCIKQIYIRHSFVTFLAREWEWVIFNKSCNLIGSGGRQKLLLEPHSEHAEMFQSPREVIEIMPMLQFLGTYHVKLKFIPSTSTDTHSGETFHS